MFDARFSTRHHDSASYHHHIAYSNKWTLCKNLNDNCGRTTRSSALSDAVRSGEHGDSLVGSAARRVTMSFSRSLGDKLIGSRRG